MHRVTLEKKIKLHKKHGFNYIFQEDKHKRTVGENSLRAGQVIIGER